MLRTRATCRTKWNCRTSRKNDTTVKAIARCSAETMTWTTVRVSTRTRNLRIRTVLRTSTRSISCLICSCLTIRRDRKRSTEFVVLKSRRIGQFESRWSSRLWFSPALSSFSLFLLLSEIYYSQGNKQTNVSLFSNKFVALFVSFFFIRSDIFINSGIRCSMILEWTNVDKNGIYWLEVWDSYNK